jgi:hypothetical protein
MPTLLTKIWTASRTGWTPQSDLLRAADWAVGDEAVS